MAYQSLYRRYRSGSFAELRGQEHVVRALRNAVREDRVGHAYLFSGPRGTGKTSTARILAKALNCENLSAEGEPCGECESCVSIDKGTSFDLHELDAASNNGVEAVRDLISRTGIGSPGRRKVYILDEVHMLSAGASNALLKTLEEPPPQVVFVLATTDPHKVLPTIRSRTQHLEFGLLPADVLEEHVRWVIADAELAVDEEGVAYAMRQGGGSARDTLSALDQVVAAGGVPSGSSSVDGVIEAVCESDTAGVMVAVAAALAAGREPRPLAEDVLARLRDIFLASVGGPLTHLTDVDAERAVAQSGRLGRATITRSLELVGEAIADMRHVGDARIPLEVALVRMTRPEVDTSVAALVDRVARLERQMASGEAPASAPSVAATGPASAPAKERTASPPPPAPRSPAPKAPAPRPPAQKATAPPAEPIASVSEPDSAEAAPVPDVAARPEPAVVPAAASSGALPGLGELEAAWGSSVLPALSGRARARYNAGTFTAVDDAAEFALPNPIHRDRCEELREEVEAALATHFGRPVPLRLVVSGGAAPPKERPAPAPSRAPAPSKRGPEPTPNDDPFDEPAPAAQETATPMAEEHDDDIDLGAIDQLDDADVATSSVDRLTELFPGAEVVEE